MNNKKTFTLIPTIAFLLLLSLVLTVMPVFSSNGTDFPLMDKFRKASFEKKKKVVEYLHQKYPGLRQEVGTYIVKNHRETMSQVRMEKALLLQKKYPAIMAKMPRTVLKDLENKYPNLVLDLAIETSTLISQKYPNLPADLVKWRNSAGFKSKTLKMIREKHPTIVKDVQAVLDSKDYRKKIAAMKSDVQEMLAQKYPQLRMRVGGDVRAYIMDKYPELPEKIAKIKENSSANPRVAIVEMICKDYPQLIPEVLTLVKDKHGKEIHNAIIDTLTLLETQHSTLITHLPADMATMMAKKHPTLLGDIMEIRMDGRKTIAQQMDKKYPDFKKDLKIAITAKFPTLGQDIQKSVKKNFPDLREDMAEMMKTKFPSLLSGIQQDVEAQHPGLQQEISRMLD